MKINMLVLVSFIYVVVQAPSARANRADHRIEALQIGCRSSPTDSASQSDLKPFSRRGRRSLLEPTAFVMVVHTIGMAMLVSMDPEETGFRPMHVNNWADGMRKPPIWDNDSWITNYILHPLWGSETYLWTRRANYTALESFFYSTAASVLWEYGFESWAEHPSKQDLLVTSTVGSLLGEIRYQAWRALLKQDAAWATALLILVDPFGMIVKYTGRLVGSASESIGSRFYSGVSLTPALSSKVESDSGRLVGLQLSVSL